MSIISKIYELTAPFKLGIRHEELIPSNMEEETILAETLYSAVSSGTESSAYKGDPPLRPGKIYPRVNGYCNVARVLYSNKCKEYKVNDIILTFQSHRSHFICSSNEVILKIYNGTNLEYATTTYLYHLGYNALLTAEATPGHNIAIIGMGLLGVATTEMCKNIGAIPLCFSDQNISEFLKKIGFLNVFSKKDPSEKDILDLTRNIGIDIVISTSNQWSDWMLALKIVRKKGKIVCLGFPGRENPIPPFNPFDSQYFYDKQVTIMSCGYTPDLIVNPEDIRFTLRHNMEYLLYQMYHGKINPENIITNRLHWSKLEDFYKVCIAKDQPYLTAILNWTIK